VLPAVVEAEQSVDNFEGHNESRSNTQSRTKKPSLDRGLRDEIVSRESAALCDKGIYGPGGEDKTESGKKGGS